MIDIKNSRVARSEHQGLGEVWGQPCAHLRAGPKASLLTLAGSIYQTRPTFDNKTVSVIKTVGFQQIFCHPGFGAGSWPRSHLGGFAASFPLCRLHCSSCFCQVVTLLIGIAEEKQWNCEH